MAHPMVVHCKKAKFDVYVGRPGPWGNPFRLAKESDRQAVLQKYRAWLAEHPEIVEAAKLQLKGKILGCWCAPKDCHADVLAEIANGQ